MSTKPNFFIIGAPKAGTTSLWAILRQHPDVFMPEVKEPNFFSRDDIYARGWEWYADLFSAQNNEHALGEASPSYCMVKSFPKVVKRIAHHCTAARIIYIVRNPYERVESAWLQFILTGHPIRGVFTKDIREYPPMLEQSLYWQTIETYRDYFPDDHILVLFFDDLKQDAHKVAVKCFRFLQVDSTCQAVDATCAHNVSAAKTKETKIFSLFRQSPIYPLVTKVLPDFLIHYIYEKFGHKPLPSRPIWDYETKQWFTNQISDDIHSLLDYTGRPRTYWF